MKIEYSIMTIPERGPAFVAGQLSAPCRVNMDAPRPGIGRHRYQGLNENFAKSIKPVNETTDYVICLHDDITLCDDFCGKAEHILKSANGRMVALYSFGHAAHMKQYKTGKHVFRGTTEWWPQALAIPAKYGHSYNAWVDAENPNFAAKAEDHWFNLWRSSLNEYVYMIYPSLAQHTGYDQSSFGNAPYIGKNPRFSKTFEPGFDAYAIDWEREFNMA